MHIIELHIIPVYISRGAGEGLGTRLGLGVFVGMKHTIVKCIASCTGGSFCMLMCIATKERVHGGFVPSLGPQQHTLLICH